ncbi:hypothetical protein [Xanthocytophaga agilis]|uniref:Lipoprotein n=1 Tax=Xanthocytophaga agilis TaxID=3048010 RepID=A0AAE3R464_9BACT|nr:hypothetical protein [Xanthocytophaga agilis]MDJ1503561.1 hypothetical protein [Xanthocytophaga agilis]
MKKHSSPKLLFCQMVVLFLASCHKEETTPKTQESILIASAQQWFESNQSSKASRIAEDLPERILIWDEAEMITLTTGAQAVALPLHYAEQDPGAGASTQLLLYPNPNGWQTQILKIISDSSYFYSNGRQMNWNNFSGIVTYYDWQENFQSGSSFRNGKRTGTLSVADPSTRAGSGCQMVTITYYTHVCIGNDCVSTKDYDIQYIECSTSGGGGGGSPLPINPTLGGGVPRPNQPLTLAHLKPRGFTIPGQDKQPIDLSKYLDCFWASSASGSYQITVYVDEPEAGSGETKFGLNVGHSFIGLKKTFADGTVIEQVFGFYPTEYTTDWVNAKFVNNGGSPYTVSATFSISAQQFLNASNAASYMTSEMYSIETQNCTDAVFYIFDATGINLPKNKSTFLFGAGSGHSPGQLGLDLRNQASQYPVNTTGGTAPNSKGPC